MTLSQSTATVSGGYDVGGLVGLMNGGTVDTSQASGAVMGANSNIGGLVGEANDSTVTNSHATGEVTGSNFSTRVGGLIGSLRGAGSSVSNSYATGAVSSRIRSGRPDGQRPSVTYRMSTPRPGFQRWFLGWQPHGYSSGDDLTGSFATGHVTGDGEDTGGLIGCAETSSLRQSFMTVTSRASRRGWLGGLLRRIIGGQQLRLGKRDRHR